MRELTQFLTYQNKPVLERYEKDYPHNTLSAAEAFTELMKFMWLCQKHKSDVLSNPNDVALGFSCIIHSEMHEIDDMWHTFLLFTRDYQQFCATYFDSFFHHDPLSLEEQSISAEQFEIQLSRYLSYIYDHLGEETVRKWFAEP